MRKPLETVLRLAALVSAFLLPSAPAAAEPISFGRVASQLQQGTPDIAPAYRVGEAIVKYRDRGADAVRGDVQSLMDSGGRFKHSIASGSDSLDRLHERYQVATATRVFRDARGGPARVGVANSSARSSASEALSHIYLLNVPANTNLIRMCEAFEADASVEYCHPNYRFEAFHAPNDRYFDSTGAWGQNYADLWGLAKIGAHDAWHEIGADPAAVTVAVVDTGVDYDHPDLAGNIWRNPGELVSGLFIPGDLNSDGCPGVCGVDDDDDGLVDEDSAGCGSDGLDASGTACSYLDDLAFDDDENGFADDHIGWDFVSDDNDPIDDVGHGTHVAGTIAATIDNAIGIVGVAPNARIMIVKGLSPTGGSTAGLVAALKYAVDQGADVINNSWGNPFAATAPDALIDAIEYATANGVVVVSAAGNSASKLGGLSRGFAPAGVPDSIAVSAFDRFDQLADFSNFGVGIDVAAPGGDSEDDTVDSNAEFVNVLSLRASGLFEDSVLRVDEDYVRFRGTSMASPHVAGVAALILSAFPQYSVEEVRQVLKLAADDTGSPGWDRGSGSGRVNAHAAVGFVEPCSALIRSPATGEVLRGSVEIRGIAAGHGATGGSNFASYRIEIAAGTLPDATDWTTIESSTTAVDGLESDLLANWSLPAELPGGEYSLRLVVVDALDREYESRIRIEVDPYDPPERLSWPRLPALGLGQLIPMIPTVADLDGDGFLEILLGPYAWRHDGTPIVNHPLGFFTNHPFSLSLFQGIHGVPAIGDIDGNGDSEVVLIHYDTFLNTGAIHVFGQDGQTMPGWPKTLQAGSSIGRTAVPVLADIDDDGTLDVIVLDSDPSDGSACQLDVYRGDGSTILSRNLASLCLTIPTVADFDGDGHPEIVVLGGDGHVTILGHTGQPAPFWPQNFGIDDAFGFAAPSVGDLDGDGGLDIVVPATNGQVYAFASNGLALDGWPIEVACCDPSIAALADLDGDGRLEVVIGDREGTLHAIDYRGQALAGWPIQIDGPANTTAAIADINGDGALEIIAVTGDRKVHAWNAAGQEVSDQGWPITTGEYAADSPFQDVLGMAAPPIVADLDFDGDREIIAFTRNLHVWDLPDTAAELPREWPMYRNNPRSSGNVDEDLVAQVPPGPRIYARPENHKVADIETFSLAFDLVSPVAQVSEAHWSVVDADDPERAEINGWLDGTEVDLAQTRALPAAIGLVSHAVRLSEPGRYRVRASIQTVPDAESGEVKDHVFTTDIIDVIAISPANPTAEMIPGPSAFARTTVAANVAFDLVEGLTGLVFTVTKSAQPTEPVLGSVEFLELGEVSVLGERDLAEPSLIGLFLAPESPTRARFAVNEVGDYDVDISIRAYPAQLRRNIEIGSASVQFTATEIPDTDADGWFDIQDNCPSLANGIDQAPTNSCAAPPCIGNQIDTNGDGYGNACDADLNGDGEVTGTPGEDCSGNDSDWCLFNASLGKTAGDLGYDADADCNGDARIDASDQICLTDQLGGPLSPSGLNCAGTFPCFKPIGDADNDALANGEDGCVFVPDVLQPDSDEDGFGNACDPDYDNDGTVAFSDFFVFAGAVNSTDVAFDHNADGIVDFGDFELFLKYFLRPPGPSGLDVLPFVDRSSNDP